MITNVQTSTTEIPNPRLDNDVRNQVTTDHVRQTVTKEE